MQGVCEGNSLNIYMKTEVDLECAPEVLTNATIFVLRDARFVELC